jgi:hypothetical protein
LDCAYPSRSTAEAGRGEGGYTIAIVRLDGCQVGLIHGLVRSRLTRRIQSTLLTNGTWHGRLRWKKVCHLWAIRRLHPRGNQAILCLN